MGAFIPLRLIKIKGKNKRMQSKLIRLIKVIFLKSTVLSVSDKSLIQ